jgi:hypothetical protein
MVHFSEPMFIIAQICAFVNLFHNDPEELDRSLALSFPATGQARHLKAQGGGEANPPTAASVAISARQEATRR